MKLALEGGALEPDPVPSDHGRLLLNIPGYEVHEEIARGGMGIVYRARQLEPRREVALKMLLPHQAVSPGMLERFRLEARAIATLEHPAILPVHHVGEHHGLPFFTMKLATGGTLAQRQHTLRDQWRGIAQLVATLADAVQFAHERGVLHRDLKPGNVLFDEADRAYVSDFGLAKLVGADSDLTRSLDLLGTPHYAAPEVASRSAKDATTASDIYSLGVILYELLAGRPPFEADGVPVLLRKIAEEEPVPPSKARTNQRAARASNANTQRDPASNPPGLLTSAATKFPRDLEVICLKCLAKDPSRRYASARDLADDLRRWLEGRTILARPATPVERVYSWARRNPALAAMGSGLAVLLVAAVVWQAHSNRRLQFALSESLLKQAQLERSSGRAGQRFETLALVARAAAHSRKSGILTSNIVLLRSEAASALTLPDARPMARWPAFLTHFENAFDFTSDLDRYVTGSPEGGFTVLSTANQKVLHHVPGPTNNPAVHLRLSADGHWAAARFQDGHAELHCLTRNLPPRRWPSDRKPNVVFAFAESRSRFAVVGRAPGKPPVAEILDLESGLTLCEVPGAASIMAFNPGATHLAVGETKLSLWRLADTNRLWSTPITHYASALAWSPDEQHLALALSHERPTGPASLETDPVLLFDALAGRQTSVLAEFISSPARLEFSRDSRSLIAATWADQLLWASTRPDGFRLIVPGAHRALRLSLDGQRLAYAPSKEELGLVELTPPAVWHEWAMVSPPAAQCFALDVSTDGRWVVTSASDGLHLWDAQQRKEVSFHPVPVKPWWMPAFFGPSDAFVYYSAGNLGVRRVALVRSTTPDRGTRLQFGSVQQVGPPRDHMTPGLASDGRSLIVGEYFRLSQNERIPPIMWLWSDGDPATARKLAENFPMVGYRQIPGSRWGITTDRITPDAWIWDFETGERVRGLGIPLQVNSESTQNGRWLATRTRQEFAVWETGTWRVLSRWPARSDEQDSGDIIASKDSRLLATDTSDGALVLRELPSGAEVVKLIPPRPVGIRQWAFSPDGKRLVILSKQGQVMEWDLAETRSELAKLGLDWRDTP